MQFGATGREKAHLPMMFPKHRRLDASHSTAPETQTSAFASVDERAHP